jgi:hypothetical protein
MPEQPPDPLHYDMKIPPEPDPNKQHGAEKPPAERLEGENETESNTTRDTNVVRGDDKPQSGRNQN